MDKKQFGQKLKELRLSKGFTQFKLAEAVDMHEKHISRIEAGVYFPSFDNFIKIMEILDLDWKDFEVSIKNTEQNSLKNKAFRIIQESNDKELKVIVPVLEQLQKSLKD